jgi:hypothetical protein
MQINESGDIAAGASKHGRARSATRSQNHACHSRADARLLLTRDRG